MLPAINPITTESWSKLTRHHARISQTHLRDLFREDPLRAQSFSLEWEEFFVDYSKTHVTCETMRLLFHLARETRLDEAIRMMFSGEEINQTENRAVLHTALRNHLSERVFSDGRDVMPEIHQVLQQIRAFSENVRSGEWKGYTGKPVRNIVNIGIGGSDLGPVMVCKALRHYGHDRLEVFFVSNVDGSHITETLKGLNADETLFLIVSKTFTTQETMANANAARHWFMSSGAGPEDISRHFVAISTNEPAVRAFGIDPANMFKFWDFVGGRFSLWSAVGLSIACYAGYRHFEELLEGARAMDRHFRFTPLEENIPVVLALTGIWYASFFGYETEAILPYDQYLERLPAYLQQAVMESNGKSVGRDGNPVTWKTSPVLWGEPGTNGQHSFFQLIHQGTQTIPCMFMAAARPLGSSEWQHKLLLSNFFAQPEALMNGKTPAEVSAELERSGLDTNRVQSLLPYKVFNGNIPSISILYKQLTPYNLGALIALFEHRIFVQGIIWNIFSFDQWGVELGKALASRIIPELEGQEAVSSHDASTNMLINKMKQMRLP